MMTQIKHSVYSFATRQSYCLGVIFRQLINSTRASYARGSIEKARNDMQSKRKRRYHINSL